MTTLTSPAAWKGVVAVIEESLTTATPVAAVPPKVTAVVPARFVPVMVTPVLPPIGPFVGEMLIIAGTGMVILNPFVSLLDWPSVLVITTFHGP